ncbi:MAG: DNA alkylation repair protein [Bacteroidia bacterium]
MADLKRRLHPWLQPLNSMFSAAGDPEIAQQQKAYMRNQFEFFGIKTPERRAILKEFITVAVLPEKSSLPAIVKSAWLQPEREYQQLMLDILMKKLKLKEPEFLPLCEYMITHKSWWDTVDMIASNIVGRILLLHPELREPSSVKWIGSEDIWLNRTAILFQLMYKTQTDTDLLFRNILNSLPTNEFFIQKAIGWVLRQYSKTDPAAVEKFVNSHHLPALSRREALRLM